MRDQELNYSSRFATSDAEVKRAQKFRASFFLSNEQGLDKDRFDPLCKHILIEDVTSGNLVCTFRLMHIKSSGELKNTYAAQLYDLSKLETYEMPVLEIGRFCISNQDNDPTILRVAWAEIAKYVDTEGINLLFGCSSFEGTDPDVYWDGFALLAKRYLAPQEWAPKTKANDVIKFADQTRSMKPNLKKANQVLPPLLRTYLTMGGWVSDHAVIDTDLSTLHVFTGVEIKLIPEIRKRLLRSVGT